ncbi:2-dehydropantoate 2-reductase [Kitasatospora sp. MMS16-BH015]|uniref:2-dehydropantoate 2-reductase n=1 Tax=Kitasatospora sp. MMS16-BH015 TaxID=2018025 RepID=UPI000CA0B1B1|nr:2-dehydropantoate 2-reductase [Kitasatospora sp. MMS16-BH015]AUG78046.1 2-dehydropantoate 2-reductase [Kitasatospora sp. MMS16-BH015]
MRILVVGAGATGGYYGGRLALAGRSVDFLVRPGRAAVLRERGLRLVGYGEPGELRPSLVLPGQLDGPYDLVLLSVKAPALAGAIADLAPAVGPGTAVLPFLNGMAHLDALAKEFGPQAVLGGVVKVLGTLDDTGDVRVLGPLPGGAAATMTFGELDGGLTPRIELVRRELAVPGFELDVSPDIRTAMWHKWAFISTLGALTTLMRGSVGEIASAGGAWLGPAILAEAAAVAEAAGHPLPDALLVGIAHGLRSTDSPDTASLYRDTAAGLPTEAEHILGDLTARARALGVPTPLLDLATLQLRVHEGRLAG